MTTAQPNRRLARWLLGCALGFCFLLAASVGAWFWLPKWAPSFVIQRSPWVEPVVRASLHWKQTGESSRELDDRFVQWGPEAYPTLSRLLHGDTKLRQAAINSYPLIVPYANAGKSHRLPDLLERVVVNVNTIHDTDRQWSVIRMNNRNHEIPTVEAMHFALLGKAIETMRTRAEHRGDASRGGPQVAMIHLELRCDRYAPYWVVDRILRLASDEEPFGLPIIGSVALTIRRDQEDRVPLEEDAIYTTIIPASAEAHTITILPGIASDPLAGAMVQVDERDAELIVGLLDQPARSHGIAQVIAKALAEAEQAGRRRPSIAIRGGPFTPWADVMTAVVAAMKANAVRGDGYDYALREGRTSPKTIILAPMFRPLDPKP